MNIISYIFNNYLIMNKKDLEKIIEDRSFYLYYKDAIDWQYTGWYEQEQEYIKQFIFETIIPETLKSIITDCLYTNYKELSSYTGIPLEAAKVLSKIWNDKLDKIKQKAKELYNITL